jgi:hypothetical protein
LNKKKIKKIKKNLAPTPGRTMRHSVAVVAKRHPDAKNTETGCRIGTDGSAVRLGLWG